MCSFPYYLKIVFGLFISFFSLRNIKKHFVLMKKYIFSPQIVNSKLVYNKSFIQIVKSYHNLLPEINTYLSHE